MQGSYISLLDDRLKPLGYFADKALQAVSDYDFFCLLCRDWILCIKRSQILNPLQNLWHLNLQDYLNNCKKIEKEAIRQVTQAFSLIKQRLQKKQLLKKRKIANKLASVERILNGEEKVCLQTYYEVANERLQDLLLLLFDRGENELLADLANIHFPDEKADPKIKPYIRSFPFSSSISHLYTLNQKRSRDNFHDSWMVWDKLCLAHWCWTHGDEFFQRQELIYDSIEDCAQSSFLLEHHSSYSEMCAIKARRKKPLGSSLFSQERFKGNLKVIMNDVLLFQQELATQTEQENKIYALGLELDRNMLYLSVEWIKDKESSRYLLHSFQEKSAQLEILRPFFADEQCRSVSLSEHSSGNNSTKFLERVGLVKELRSVFVETNSTYTITFRGKRIELKSPVSIDQTKLIQQIETLPPKR